MSGWVFAARVGGNYWSATKKWRLLVSPFRATAATITKNVDHRLLSCVLFLQSLKQYQPLTLRLTPARDQYCLARVACGRANALLSHSCHEIGTPHHRSWFRISSENIASIIAPTEGLLASNQELSWVLTALFSPMSQCIEPLHQRQHSSPTAS